jgi:hypothetical protein
MRMQALIGDATTASEFLRSTAELAMVLAPTIEQQGIASLADIGCDTLFERIVRDVTVNRSMVIGRAEIGAWVRP